MLGVTWLSSTRLEELKGHHEDAFDELVSERQRTLGRVLVELLRQCDELSQDIQAKIAAERQVFFER